MKKRIISLILVAAMALLTLASCGFSYSNEKLDGKYTGFNAALFAEKLAAIKIEDGDFTTDPAKRDNMVMDAIYAALAKGADTEDKQTEGEVGAHDLVYYCYYVTATIDGVEYQFMTDKMKASAAVSVQLGQLAVDDEDTLTKGLLQNLVSFTFSKDAVYEETTEGKIVADQYVYVSYVKTKTVDGVVSKETVANERVKVTESDEFTKQLIGKNIGTSEIAEIADVDGWKYDDVYVKYAEKTGSALNGGEGYTIEGVVLYPKDENPDGKKVDATFYAGDDSTKKSIDLVDVELTYHVFPTHFVKVDEYNVKNVVNEILGSSITIDYLAKIMLQKAYIDLLDEDGHEHDNEDAIEALYDSIMIKDADDKELDLNEFATALAAAQSAFATAEKDYKDALKKYETAYDAYKEAYEKFYGNGDDIKGATAEKNEADDKVNNAETGTKKLLEDAIKAFDDAAKDATVKAAYDALKAALEAAKTAYAEASADTEKKAAYDAAKKALDDAKAAAEADPENADKAAAVVAAQAAYDANELRVLEVALEKAQKDFDEDALRKIEIAKENAEKNNKDATAELTSKTTAWENAWKTLKSKRTAFATARKTFDGTADYIMSDLDAGYAEKKAAYDAALEALLAADKNNTEDFNAKKTAFIEARKAFAINPDDPTTADVETDKAPAEDLTPVDANYKKDEGKKGPYDEALTKRDKFVTNLEAKVTEKEINFLFGYEYYVQYKNLEKEYNKAIKNAVAKEVYNTVIKVVVEIKDKPAADHNKVYEELIDNYQFFFYENYNLESWVENQTLSARDAEKDGRYYDKYGASFERFMVEYVAKTVYGLNNDDGSLTYDKVKGAVRDHALNIVIERLNIYATAEYLGVKFTDASFKQYAKDNKDIENIFEYDEGVVENYRLAYQLEVILDTILGIKEELATEAAGNRGYIPTNVTYNATYFPNGIDKTGA